jgi:hypothetical protein
LICLIFSYKTHGTGVDSARHVLTVCNNMQQWTYDQRDEYFHAISRASSEHFKHFVNMKTETASETLDFCS